MEKNKKLSMQAFLRSNRKCQKKQFLGVIGSYLIELLDNDSIIPKLLSKSQFRYTPSEDSRFSGPSRRMVLKTFANDAIVIIRTHEQSADHLECLLAIFVNNSDTSSEDLLQDARRLATFRWSKIPF